MKVLILGDTHGNTGEALMAVSNAALLEINTIVQCGDFGLWDHKLDGIQFLDDLNAALRDHAITLTWVDGNHENFDRLDWYVKNNPKNKWGQVYIRDSILYTPRGCRWKLDGKQFMSVGGAVSVDKAWRKEGQSWWPQEQLTQAQLDNIIGKHERSPGRVDYMFTHDCPTNAPFGDRLKEDHESQIHRQRMDRLGKAIKPGMWFHGHMHSKYDGYRFPVYDAHTKVYGLECDGMVWNWGVLETELDEFTWGDHFADSIRYKLMEKAEPFQIDDDF